MNYLLDSNTVSDLYNRESPQHAPISKRFAALNDNGRVCAGAELIRNGIRLRERA